MVLYLNIEKRITFTEECLDDVGIITIDGIAFPHKTFNPLAKIWASVRKVNFKAFGTDATGVFYYDDDQRSISCLFHLNYANHERDAKNHAQLFRDTFADQAKRFEAAIIDFVNAEENGYSQYVLMTHMGTKQKELDEMFNEHLAQVGLRPKK